MVVKVGFRSVDDIDIILKVWFVVLVSLFFMRYRGRFIVMGLRITLYVRSIIMVSLILRLLWNRI